MATNSLPRIPRVDYAARQAAVERLEAHRRLVELEDQEPECTCAQTDVDLFDARGCELHNPNSWWNVALRAVTPVERYEQYEPAVAQECSF